MQDIILNTWEYYRKECWLLIISFFLFIIAPIISLLFGYNALTIILLTFSIFIYLNVYLRIYYIIGVFKGILAYILILFMFIYCFSNIYLEYGIINDKIITHECNDTIYFSIVTWTTLGYGDFQPTENSRIWAAIESMMGYIYMGILVGLIISGLTHPRKVNNWESKFK